MEETPTSHQPSFSFPSNPSSQIKRYHKYQNLSFGTPEPENINSNPKFESIMKGILSRINFFHKDDIIPYQRPEKLETIKKPESRERKIHFENPEISELQKNSQKTLKRPPKIEENPSKLSKSSKHIQNPKRPEQVSHSDPIHQNPVLFSKTQKKSLLNNVF